MYKTIKDTEIYYEEIGIGKPILFLHGFPEDHKVMLGCIEPILQDSTTYRRIYLDLPGMGKSKPGTTLKDADAMLDIIQQFIEEIIGTESFLLVGLSYGGYLSLGLMLKIAHQIDGLFLICPCTISNKTNRTLPDKSIIIDKDFNMLETQDFKDFLEYAVIVNANTWERYQEEILPGLQSASEDFINEYQSSGYSFSFESDFISITTSCPVSLITGKQDNCVGFEDSYSLLKHIPQLNFTCIENAGHNLQIEHPDIFSAAFNLWLEDTNNNMTRKNI